MRTSLYREVGPYRPDLPHTGDFYLWLSASCRADVGQVCGSDQAFYRVHESNMHESMFGLGNPSGLLVDLTHRRTVFGILFAEEHPGLSNPGELENIAYRSLAVEAIDLASRALTWGMHDWPVEDLAAWARETYPAAPELRAWRAYERRVRLTGRGEPNRVVREGLAVRERALSVSRKVRNWRWRQAAV